MKICNLLFIMLIESFAFLVCAQNTENGFKLVKLSSDRFYYEDINTEKYEAPLKDRQGRELSVHAVQYKNQREELISIEKSIFTPEERKQIQKYNSKPIIANVLIEAVSGNVVCVSFSFGPVDDSFKFDTEKLAKYREEIKRNIKFDKISFRRGDVVSGSFYQMLRVFMD
ncbi:hypothetical protein [Proteiniphilum sp.]|uniref:hypothetical protein n=1 Tax=Proteiniphilum sp. TaxID=1926877 RepID=UPI002B21E280|nr:hypothetical protein [Proteiniphilum sp.]MEA4916271.1 hypothetical protein [Proteiniphilum sp.]